MHEMAKTLDDIITKYGFGCEIELDELFEYENIEKLIDEGFLEKNPLNGRFYLTDIFTCNSFLQTYLIKDETPKQTKSEKTLTLTIDKKDLTDTLLKLKGSEDKICKIEIESIGEEFEIIIRLYCDDDFYKNFRYRMLE